MDGVDAVDAVEGERVVVEEMVVSRVEEEEGEGEGGEEGVRVVVLKII